MMNVSRLSVNTFIIDDGKTHLLIDCDLNYDDLKKESDFFVPCYIDAILVSNTDKNNLETIKHLSNEKVDMYMLYETMKQLNIHKTFRHHIYDVVPKNIFDDLVFTIGTFNVTPFYKNGIINFNLFSKVTKFYAVFDCVYGVYSLSNKLEIYGG